MARPKHCFGMQNLDLVNDPNTLNGNSSTKSGPGGFLAPPGNSSTPSSIPGIIPAFKGVLYFLTSREEFLIPFDKIVDSEEWLEHLRN